MADELAISLVKKFEGCRLHAYQDAGGVWTVGWGATGPTICQGTTWSQASADADLAIRVAKLQQQISELVTVPLSPEQFAALVSFAYNVGIFAFTKSTLLRLLNHGDYKSAAESMLLWNHVHGVVDNVLDNRRKAERAIFLKESA